MLQGLRESGASFLPTDYFSIPQFQKVRTYIPIDFARMDDALHLTNFGNLSFHDAWG